MNSVSINNCIIQVKVLMNSGKFYVVGQSSITDVLACRVIKIINDLSSLLKLFIVKDQISPVSLLKFHFFLLQVYLPYHVHIVNDFFRSVTEVWLYFFAAENHVFGPGWDSITHSSHCEKWSPRRALALKLEIGTKSFWHTAVQCCILHHSQHLQTLVCYCSPYFKAFLEPNVPFLATYKAERSELLWFMLRWTAMTFEWTINMRSGTVLCLNCKWCIRWFHRECDIAIL